MQQKLNFQVLMRSQNLNEAHKSKIFASEVLEMSQKKVRTNFFIFAPRLDFGYTHQNLKIQLLMQCINFQGNK
jgi:hypothetical protein